MEEILKTQLFAYSFLSAIIGIFCFCIIFGTFKKTKCIKNKKIKTVLRSSINGALICFWLWYFVYINLCPILTAYYEYKNNLFTESTGVIENMEYDGKDKIIIIIDGEKYTFPRAHVDFVDKIERTIGKGDTVNIVYGEKSNYIFEIEEVNKQTTGY